MSNKNMSNDLENRGWENMTVLLDKEMPQRRVGVVYWIWILLFLIIGTLLFFLLKQGNTTSESNTSNEEIAVVQKQETLQDAEVHPFTTEIRSKKEDVQTNATTLQRTEQEYAKNSSNSISGSQTDHKKSTESQDNLLDLKKEALGKSLSQKNDGHEQLKSTSGTQIENSINALPKLSLHTLNELYVTADQKLTTASINEFAQPSNSFSTNQNIWPDYVQFQFVNDLFQNIGIDLSSGWEYSLSPKWSFQTGLAYSFDYIGARSRKVSYDRETVPDITSGQFSNDEFREEFANYLNTTYSNNGDVQWTPLQGAEIAFLRYGDLSQHLFSLEQNMLYRITGLGSRSALYAKAGGRISYTLLTSSSSDLLIAFPVVSSSGTVNFDNSGTVSIDPGSTYIPRWYYGLHAGLGIHLNQNWSMELNASTLQSFDRAKDYLELNKKRDIRFTLGVRRYL